MPKYYYSVREAHTLLSLASPPFGLRAFYAHTRTMVGCTALAVLLTQFASEGKSYTLKYIYMSFPIAVVYCCSSNLLLYQ